QVGRLEEADKLSRTLPERNPKAPLSYIVAAGASTALKDYDRSETYLRKAIELAGDSAVPYSMLGQTQALKGQYLACFQSMQKAVEVEPESPLGHFFLGVTYLNMRQPKLAAASVQKALDLGVDGRVSFAFREEEAWHILGTLRQQLGEKDEAIKAYSRCVDLARQRLAGNVETAKWTLSLAQILEWNQRAAESLSHFENFLDLPAANPRKKPGALDRLYEATRLAWPALPTHASVERSFELSKEVGLLWRGADWKFYRKQEAPSAGTEWAQRDFDDSSWETGNGPFGYGDGDDQTVLDDMKGRYTSVYLRRYLGVPTGVDYERFELLVHADDGFVAYLDGREVGRHLVARTDNHEDSATASVLEPLAAVVCKIPAEVLGDGKPHLIAIRGVNREIDSSDFTLSPTLRGIRRSNTRGAEELLTRFASNTTDEETSKKFAHFQALVLEARGQLSEAGLQFVIATSKNDPAPETILGRARCLRGLGQAENAATYLAEHLAKGCGPASLWEYWLSICFDELALSPAQTRERWPAAQDCTTKLIEKAWKPASAPLYAALLLDLEEHGKVRINCGGAEIAAEEGPPWRKDRFFESGVPYRENVEGTRTLEHNWRVFHRADRGQREYRIPVPNGRYRLRLNLPESLAPTQLKLGNRAIPVETEHELEVRGGLLRLGFETPNAPALVYSFELTRIESK
ncbi:MAG: hypothetical protein AAF517_02790, partial [Planctomycetota bacterium]